MLKENRIIGVSGGLYTVETPSGEVYAKSRGVFRLNGIKPVTGDYVSLQFEDNAETVITDVLERENEIIRPPLANIDITVLVVSSCEPPPNLFILDKLTAIFESKGIETVFAFTKIDLAQAEKYAKIYSDIGYKTFMIDNTGGAGSESLIDFLKGKTSALIGNTGVGKSSLMKYIAPMTEHKTSEISKKLGRGKHTTREVKLYRPYEDTYIADTPGFSTVEISRYGSVPSEEVVNCFRELREYADKCRFKNCAHVKEDGCAVREAVKDGYIAPSRHESYCRIYEETVKKERDYRSAP